MLIKDRKRIARYDEIVPVRDSLLFGRQIVRAQKTRAIIDRVLINLRRGASNPSRVMLNDDLGFLEPDALCFDLAERFVALRQLRPRRALLIDQRRYAGFKTVIAFISLISA